MKNIVKIKIIGAGPTGLLLALALSRFNTKIFINDLLSEENLKSKDKTYAITHSSRKILEKFNLWNKLKSKITSFDSLSITDTIIDRNSIFNISDLDYDIRDNGNIGWVVKHSDLNQIFFEELSRKNNIFFSSFLGNDSISDKYDYTFACDGSSSLYRKTNKFLYFKKLYNHSCLTFKVFIRGYKEGRAYELFRKEGPLALLPLSKNVYQIIWTANSEVSKIRLNSNKNLLLDNLSTILPREIHLDQIVGDINIFPVSLSFAFPDLNFKRHILVGDALHTFHPVGGQGLNACWRDVNSIYNLLNSNNGIKEFSLFTLKLRFYINRIADIFSLYLVTDSLIKLFANDYIFLLPLRIISFKFLNNFRLFRKLIINYMTKSISFKSLK